MTKVPPNRLVSPEDIRLLQYYPPPEKDCINGQALTGGRFHAMHHKYFVSKSFEEKSPKYKTGNNISRTISANMSIWSLRWSI